MAGTYTPKGGEITRGWVLIDAQDEVLGRLASRIAVLLRGKHKPIYSQHMDTGDYVVVINAAGVRLTGAKAEQKKVYSHSGYPGGLRTQQFADVFSKYPERMVEKAVRGMLPKNKLGKAMARKLKVYAGGEHPHEAQKPVPYKFEKISQVG